MARKLRTMGKFSKRLGRKIGAGTDERIVHKSRRPSNVEEIAVNRTAIRRGG